MRREEIPDYFINKKIKLVKQDGFFLIGFIRNVNQTNLFFETDQAAAMISLDSIRELVLRREGNND